ncbi:hypothetical protein I656_03890 [Geobacillus sp. WSUCF1]|nr:hypothetical protein I656_03890 [Geobacillus sp. WSUCF1]
MLRPPFLLSKICEILHVPCQKNVGRLSQNVNNFSTHHISRFSFPFQDFFRRFVLKNFFRLDSVDLW